MSVMVTWVLLNVARILAMPMEMFLAPLALMIFLRVRIFAEQLSRGRGRGSDRRGRWRISRSAGLRQLRRSRLPLAAFAGFSAFSGFGSLVGFCGAFSAGALASFARLFCFVSSAIIKST